MDEVKQPASETSNTLIDSARDAALRLEKANQELRALLDRQEELAAKQLLGGRTEASSSPLKLDPVVEEKKRLNELFAGTGINIK